MMFVGGGGGFTSFEIEGHIVERGGHDATGNGGDFQTRVS